MRGTTATSVCFCAPISSHLFLPFSYISFSTDKSPSLYISILALHERLFTLPPPTPASPASQGQVLQETKGALRANGHVISIEEHLPLISLYYPKLLLTASIISPLPNPINTLDDKPIV